MAEKEIGKVTHYFGNIGVAAIDINANVLSVGDTIHIKGHTSDFIQTIHSMELNGEAVQQAFAGHRIGIKVAEHTGERDAVYKVTD